MHIQENVNLAAYSTMRLGGKARYLATFTDTNELSRLVDWAKEKYIPCWVVGHGSNIVWRDEGFDGLILVNKISGRELKDSADSATMRIGAGETWDDIVAWSVVQNLSGIECLSLIPGTVGATPVQNVGAYGQEISQTLLEVEAFEVETDKSVKLSNSDCIFSYRSSRFKTKDKGKFIITYVTLKLSKADPEEPTYESLKQYLQDHHITTYTPAVLREAVIDIRQNKLPDPKLIANNGSFFTNPIISKEQFEKLKATYPEIKSWPSGDMVKLSAAWLVEKAGFKDVHDKKTGMATWPAQALVLVNEHAKKTADLLTFKQKIVDKVQEMFDITLVQEPELLP